MKILKFTDTHIYILTDSGHQLKLINPGHKRKSEVYEWLEMVASDYDINMKASEEKPVNLKWDINNYMHSDYQRTKDDYFIEFLLVIKQLYLDNKLTDEEKIKKVKEYANKVYENT